MQHPRTIDRAERGGTAVVPGEKRRQRGCAGAASTGGVTGNRGAPSFMARRGA
jgi:hypothetical protein